MSSSHSASQATRFADDPNKVVWKKYAVVWLQSGTAKNHSVLQSINPYYEVLLGTTKYYSVLQSTTPYYNVLLRTTKYYTVLQSITQYYSVLQSTTPYYTVYSVQQSATQYYYVLQSIITLYYKVLLRTANSFSALQCAKY